MRMPGLFSANNYLHIQAYGALKNGLSFEWFCKRNADIPRERLEEIWNEEQDSRG